MPATRRSGRHHLNGVQGHSPEEREEVDDMESEEMIEEEEGDVPLEDAEAEDAAEEEPPEDHFEEEAGSETTTQSGTDSMTWISWFCSLPGHEYFAEVSEDFIEDDFNLTGLNALVPFYKEALEMVLDVEPEEESLKVPDVSIVESSAELLYGLIHQRYIITRQGLQQMLAKYEDAHFGYCPRVYCSTTKVLPCGRSDLPGVDTVKLFCPTCMDTYTPPSSRFNNVDGAFFGTTFPHLLFQTFKELLPTNNGAATSRGASPAAHSPSAADDSGAMSPTTPPPVVMLSNNVSSTVASGGTLSGSRIYVPRIYGFKVSERARSGPRMQWLRIRPRPESEANELDRVDNFGRWKEGQAPNSVAVGASAMTSMTTRGRGGIIDSPRPSPPLENFKVNTGDGSKRKTMPVPSSTASVPARRSSAVAGDSKR